MMFLKRKLLKILFNILTLSFLGLGCSRSNNTSDNQAGLNKIPQSQGVNFKSVQLADLPSQPIIVYGESSDHKVTFVQIQNPADIHSYEIDDDGQVQSMKEISNSQLAIPKIIAVPVLTNFKLVQAQLMRDRYTDLFRCRYTSAWRELAAIDLRESGPLFLSIEAFRNAKLYWTWLIAIDQPTMKVIGLSGIKLEWYEADLQGNYFASSLKSQNNIFGLNSEALVSYGDYYTLCSLAYRSALTSGPNEITPEYLVPSKEREISRHSEILDDLRGGSNLRRKDVHFIDADASKYNENFKNTSVSMKEIENLIHVARENNGVGL